MSVATLVGRFMDETIIIIIIIIIIGGYRNVRMTL
jgi:hypothetical protein